MVTGENDFYETNRYRCLFRDDKISDALYVISCGIERCRPGKRVDIPDREGYHLHVVLAGNGVLTVGGVSKEIKAGQMFLLKPGEASVYQADATNPWVYCWVNVDGTDVANYLNRAGFTEGCNVLPCNIDGKEFLALVQKMLDHSKLDFINDLMRTGAAFEFLSLVVESYNKSKRSSGRYSEYSPENYAETAVSMIEENYSEITVADIAKAIGIHRSRLFVLFKERTGVSPQEYILDCRMKEGCRLLRETSYSIQQIAEKVGYDNPLTFSKIFKKNLGVSPREYRNSVDEEIRFDDNKKGSETGNK